MNVDLAKKIVKLTPKNVLHPSDPTLDSPLPLSSGNSIPGIGLAVWTTESEPDQIKDKVSLAIKSGYRHFDTTAQNEFEVGDAIRRAVEKGKVKREDVFITATLRKGFESKVEASLAESLENLGLEYVDMVVLEFEEHTFMQAWERMTHISMATKTRSIGISNINAASLKTLLESTLSIPSLVRVPLNPTEPQRNISSLCTEKNIVILSYDPFGSNARSSLINHTSVVELAKRHSTVPEDILLSWHIARNGAVLVDEVILGGSEKHRKLTQLSESDVAVLDGISA